MRLRSIIQKMACPSLDDSPRLNHSHCNSDAQTVVFMLIAITFTHFFFQNRAVIDPETKFVCNLMAIQSVSVRKTSLCTPRLIFVVASFATQMYLLIVEKIYWKEF